MTANLMMMIMEKTGQKRIYSAKWNTKERSFSILYSVDGGANTLQYPHTFLGTNKIDEQ